MNHPLLPRELIVYSLVLVFSWPLNNYVPDSGLCCLQEATPVGWLVVLRGGC